MNMDELRELKTKWDRMNSLAVKVCTFYLAPIGLLSVYGITIVFMHLITLALVSEFKIDFIKNLFPILVLIGLIFCIVQMKYDNIKGHIGTIILYFAIGAGAFSVDVNYDNFFALSLIPMFFVFRCVVNYKVIVELRTMPGYPFFIYTVAEKFADQVYIQDKRFSEIEPVSPEEYIPWNAFDENEDENTTDNKDIKGEG